MKIWNSKNQKINQKVDTFLSGEDIHLDNEIFIFDVDASIAHTEELLAIKLLTGNEASLLQRELKKIKKDFLSGKLTLNKKFEDCHSAIEYLLIKELGDIGKKIHTGRSRNDQVLVALRLYQQHYLKIIRDLVRIKKGKQKNAEDYFLASKSLPWWAVGASLIAANISAEQFIGMSGSGFALGLAIASYEWIQ